VTMLGTIGGTPLVEVEGVHVKLECANPGGSVKDRVALYLLERAANRGELRPGDTVVETSSGNTGISLALIACRLGHRVIIYMPEHMSVERKQLLEGAGAEVRLTPRASGFGGAIAERDAYRGRPGFYVPDQFGNPDNVRCHRETTGAEIIAQLAKAGVGKIDYFVSGVGTGGTLMGVGAALRAAMPNVKVAAVEPAESRELSGGAPGDHGIMGIGDGFVPGLVDMKMVDEILQISTEEAHAAAARIRERHGYCVGRSAGANFTAALRLRERGASVVTVWPDCANRYVSLGLKPPSSPDVTCPLREGCESRSRSLFEGRTAPERGA